MGSPDFKDMICGEQTMDKKVESDMSKSLVLYDMQLINLTDIL